MRLVERRGRALHPKDPDYYWKRMLGWQAAGGPDEAPFGLYAVPPSAWAAAPPIVLPPVPPAPGGATEPNPDVRLLSLVLKRLDDLERLLVARPTPVGDPPSVGLLELATQINLLRGEVLGFTQILATPPVYEGSLFGYTLRLTAVAPPKS